MGCMCGRYVLFSTAERISGSLRKATGVDSVTIIKRQVGDSSFGQPSYNIAPTQEVAIVRPFRQGFALGPAWWGYPRHHARSVVFNARGETAWDKPFFAGSQRCLFPMDGWYEWAEQQPLHQPCAQIDQQSSAHPGAQVSIRAARHTGTDAAAQTGTQPVRRSAQRAAKQPWYTHSSAGEPLWVAGLFSIFAGQVYATIVTCAAIDSLQWLHHRMPRVMMGQEVSDWLEAPDDVARRMAGHAPSEVAKVLVSREADRRVGNVAQNGPYLIGG